MMPVDSLSGGGWAGWTLAWLGTYLLHSTVLLGGAWAASIVVRSPGARDALWKAASVGGLLTATLHLATARPPVHAPALPRVGVPLPAHASAPPLAGDALVGLWMVGALAGLAGLERGRRRYWREAGPRHAVADPEAASTLRRLRDAARVERTIYLTTADGLQAPAAIGLAEICLPAASLAALTPAQRESVMAHELGHLARRDPLWRMASELLAAVFFFQPLHRVARRELAECAELLCDGFAVRITGRRRPLVESLGVLAATLGPRGVAAAAGFGGSGSPLVRRAMRLMDPSRAPARPLPAIARAALGLGLIAATLGFVPGMQPPIAARQTVVRSLKLQGAQFDAAHTGILRVDPGGFVDLAEDDDGVRRELSVRRGADGNPAYEYRENGARKPYDASARQWTARALDHR